MPRYKQTHNFSPNDGMDYDSDLHAVAPGDSIYRFCVRSGIRSGNIFVVTNLKGNELQSFTLPSGINLCRGSCEDIENDAIIYIVSNRDLKDCIIRFFPKTKVFQKILWEHGLNLSDRIHGMRVVGELLYWTDNINPPRKINITKAYNYTNGIADNHKYLSINDTIISVVKNPPQSSPIAEYGNSPATNYNNLYGKLWQFSYSYVYDDNEESVPSPYSKIPLPQGEEDSDGTHTNSPGVNNIINIFLSTGPENVKKVRIFAREGNLGDWYLIDTIKKYDEDWTKLVDSDTTYTYEFRNDRIREGVDQNNHTRSFDYVPLLAQDLEIIENNRLVFANILEGYDPVDINVNMTVMSIKKDFDLEIINLRTNYDSRIDTEWLVRLDCGVGDYVRVSEFGYIYIPILYENKLYTVTVNAYDGNMYSATISPTAAECASNNLLGFCIRMVDQLIANGMPQLIYYDNTNINYATARSGEIMFIRRLYFKRKKTGCTVYDVMGANTISGNIQSDVSQYKYPSFKKGAYHPFGIVYYDDALRSTSVLTSEDMVKYVEFSYLSGIAENRQVYMSLFIRHLPPIWATRYQIVYAKNSTVNSFMQYYIDSNIDIENAPDGRNVRININQELGQLISAVRNTNVPLYSFTKGDRIRFIAKINNLGARVLFGEYLDFEIISQDIGSDPDYIYLEPFDFASYKIPEYNFWEYEIYSPRKGLGEKLFYEIGECYEIGNPGTTTRYHKGGYQDQNPANPIASPARMYIYGGDVYLKVRFGIDVSFPVEDYHYSDFYDSNNCNIGRVNAIIDSYKQTRLQNIRHSNKYFDNTQINGLSTFEVNNVDVVPDKYGEIQRIMEVGYTLKILQKNKNSSIYVNRTVTKESNGSSNVILKDGVLGSLVIPEVDYGTEHPESVVKFDRHLYFYDINRAAVVRDAPNGMHPVSNYKFNAYLRDITNRLIAPAYDIPGLLKSMKIQVCAGVDKDNGEVYMNFARQDLSALNANPKYNIYECAIFNDDTNRWKMFLPSYIGTTSLENFCSAGKYFMSFISGNLYLHNSDNVPRNYFYGTQYQSIIRNVFNENANKVKVFDASEINSTAKWHSGTNGDIYIPACSMYPLGMRSRLIESKYEGLEGKYYSEYLNNIDTPNMTVDEGLIDGEKLRGQTLVQTFRNSNTDEVKLFSVSCLMTDSELS